MIFVTVGTQLTFDRLINTIDQWAATSSDEVIAQIGPSDLKPKNMLWQQFLSPTEFSEYIEKARVIIAHAGMGSILTAMQFKKPIIILPRREKFGEHRNDHQFATAKQFINVEGIHVAMDDGELVSLLQSIQSLTVCSGVSPYASPELLTAITCFIEES